METITCADCQWEGNSESVDYICQLCGEWVDDDGCEDCNEDADERCPGCGSATLTFSETTEASE